MDVPVAAPFTTPVLLIIFNRPDTTARVLDTLRQARVPRLYVAADGPRPHRPADADRCAEARRVATAVDWDCEVRTFFREQNVGCARNPSAGISWFFEHESEGIILEDDIVPDPTFFSFCQELLARYRHDGRIAQIAASNFLQGWTHDPDYSYHFSGHGSTWGWASWRRAWQYFDLTVPHYDELRRKGLLSNYFYNRVGYVLDKLAAAHARDPRISWWDYQWDLARYQQSLLTIVPNVNLAANIGDGDDATHTKGKGKTAPRPAVPIGFPLRHPPYVLRDRAADDRHFELLYRGAPWRRFKNGVKRLLPKALRRDPPLFNQLPVSRGAEPVPQPNKLLS